KVRVNLATLPRPRSGNGRFTSRKPTTPPLSTVSSTESELTELPQSRASTPNSDHITPPTSPAPILVTPAASSDDNMPIEVTPFWGNGTNDENGQDFLRAYNRAMAKETEEHKLAQFQNYLHSQSIADDWYTSLNANIKTSWDTLQAAFNNRWPNTAIVRKTKAEYELEIVGKKLMVEVLGKTKLVGGREVYTHTAWADEMARLVLEADVTGTTYITQVRKGLPTIIRDKLEEEYESWTAFLTAVKGISATYIKEKKEDEEERRKEIMQLIESPRTELSRVLGNTTLGPSPPSAPVTNPPLRTGVGLGFGPRPPQQPRAYPAQGQRVYSPQEREAFRARMNTLPHHPNTEAGRAAHQAQQKAWRDQYGLTATVTEMTPYPLRPGT
ncbi:hypothetical protein H0H93_011782, partial [Arthromyces matolae]